jgi:hypothetical protein
LPEQLVALGEHTPLHDPPLHTYWHGVVFCQLPFESQVWISVPEHCTEPGVQEPTQAPPTHAWPVHATGLVQLPVVSHVWTPFPEHCVAPCAHSTQVPLKQTGLLPVQATALPYWPFEPQVCTPPPEHWVVPGEHTPVHAPPLHTY